MTDQSNIALLDEFYAAFGRHDGIAMAQCYAPDASFSDPVFVGLTGDQPGGMSGNATGSACRRSLRVQLLLHALLCAVLTLAFLCPQ